MTAKPFRQAIIDIGSNSIRLVVFGAGHSKVLYDDKVVASLGRGVVAVGKIDRASQDLALAALSRFAALVRLVEPQHLRVVATAAVRDAANGAQFMKAVRKLGLPVELLSGEDEARAAARGVLVHFPGLDGLVADLGGGSLELARVAGGEVLDCTSLPFGVMRVAAIRAGGRGRMRKALARALAPHGWLAEVEGKRLVVVGGAWRALGRVQARLVGRDEGAPLTLREARRVKAFVRKAGAEALAQIPGVSAARAAQQADAASLLAALMAEVPVADAVVSASGIREGLLASRPTELST
jgi:exopolyphosphatase/guanosine-5'-triphosphate,3'-diphosphate pyrophosphatase